MENSLVILILIALVAAAITLGVTFGSNESKPVDITNSTIEKPPDRPEPPRPSPTDEPPDEPIEETPSGGINSFEGPFKIPIRTFSPSIVEGYGSCDELKADIVDSLKLYANEIIKQEMNNNWHEKCDPDAVIADPPIAMPIAEEGLASSSPLADSSSSGGRVQEDSFDTNNQVEGVDEADIVKSDGSWVFAGYSDVLYVWNATNGNSGMSITRMPYNSTNDKNCSTGGPPVMPFPEPVINEDVSIEESPPAASEGQAGSGSGSESVESTASFGGNRRNQLVADISRPFMPPPCGYEPKPRIVSLLTKGNRLTAIVSQSKGFYYGPFYGEEYKPSVIDDNSKLSIRVYDISNVPTDGSPLTLLGEREILGNYNDARSIEETGIIIATSYVNTWMFSEELYRYRPQYCGMNSTAYAELAAEIALNNTQPFMEQMVEELKLDGSCDHIFQIAAMQTGEDTTLYSGGDLMGQFVQVTSFNMTDEYSNMEIAGNVSGSFVQNGYLNSVYVSQNFAGLLNVGYDYVDETWKQSTFVLGFDLSDGDPTPFCVGAVSGGLLNQYAADLHDGHLRIATTEWTWTREADGSFNSETLNKVFVLKVPLDGEGPIMPLIGETGHLGKENESIFAVRFIEDSAYIVTFERTDPFIILNMTDHSAPNVTGELEIPGFSSYLHPIEIDGVKLMLGIGQHVNETTGWTEGVKISLFDISNPSAPTERAFYVDKDAYSNAQHDFKSFRYLPLSQKLILPKSEYTWTDEGNFDGFVVYNITLDDIVPTFEISHASSDDIFNGCWYDAYMPPRSLVFKSKVTTILSHTVISTDLYTGEREWELNLDENLNNTVCQPYFIYF